MDWNLLIQAIIAMVMIAGPISPEKIILFNDIIERERLGRTAAATRVAFTVFIILGGAAAIGKELLELLNINQDAFSVVGGLIIAGMGFEMLYAGSRSRAQGGRIDEEKEAEEGGLLMPLSIPLIAGPGAIATVITISGTQGSWWTLLAAVVGALFVGLLAFISFEWLGGLMTRISEKGTMLVVRIGGLVLATLGMQMMLGGLKKFFG